MGVYREHLDQLIISTLRINGGRCTRPELCKYTQAPTTTVFDHLVKLELCGAVRRLVGKTNKQRGRPKIYWSLIKR